MSDVLRVVLADDHYLVREGIRWLLEDTGEVVVVDTVGSADELLAAVERLAPDAVVTDIKMPPDHHRAGIVAAQAIRRQHPRTGVVVLSQYADSLYAQELLAAGTAGLAYLLKDRVAELDELVAALRAVVAGRAVIDPRIVESLVSRGGQDAGSALASLTPRETEVLRLMAAGRANAGIMKDLMPSESAVQKHINSIFAKLGLEPEPETHRRVAAVLAYLRQGGRTAPPLDP